jgi:hypothetical protein
VAVRAPNLYRSLRCFCLAAFAVLGREVETGEEIPFAFEEHASRDRPALYEYRPLVRSYVEARSARLAGLADARFAIDELEGEAAAAVFAAAHAGQAKARDALYRSVLLPLVTSVAEVCGGFDWDDAAYDRAYVEFERTLFGTERAYAAVAPLIGVSAPTQVELGSGLRVRLAADGELAAHWPEATGLLPPDFGREPDRLCVLELERGLGGGEPPDSSAEIADAVSALRLATSAAIAAGPVLFERLDWRPLGIRPVLPIAATQPGGEPTRLDAFRGQLAADLLEKLGLADEDPELAEALDRWELSLFADEPYRSEQLRESLAALLGGPDGLPAAAFRASVLLGETGRERADHLARLRELCAGGTAGDGAADAVRKALVETLAHGDRARLITALDDSLVGLRPRPAGYFAAIAS